MTDRKARGQRTAALTCGLMAEVLLGTAILIWSGSTTVGGRAAFGPGGSLAVVAIAMVLVAVFMGVVAFGHMLNRPTLLVGVVVVSLTTAGLGVVALAAMVDDAGIGILLIFGWILTMPVTLGVTRAHAVRRRER